MKITSIQSNQNFEGSVSVRNRVARLTKVYKTTPETDRVLADSYEKIHKALDVEAGISNIKGYIAELYKVTKDEFLNKLPALVKEDSQEVELSSKSVYATYRGGDTYSELKTKGFEIIHDMAK